MDTTIMDVTNQKRIFYNGIISTRSSLHCGMQQFVIYYGNDVVNFDAIGWPQHVCESDAMAGTTIAVFLF